MIGMASRSQFQKRDNFRNMDSTLAFRGYNLQWALTEHGFGGHTPVSVVKAAGRLDISTEVAYDAH
jgi:hypothetical protein